MEWLADQWRAGEPSWVVGVSRQVFSWRWLMLTAGLLVVGPYWYINSSGRGWIQPAFAEADVGLVARRAEQWQRRGAPVSVLDRPQMLPRIATADIDGAEFARRRGLA